MQLRIKKDQPSRISMNMAEWEANKFLQDSYQADINRFQETSTTKSDRRY